MKQATIWTLDIPGWHPSPLNQLLGHHMKAARLKKHDREIITKAVKAYAVTVPTTKRSVSLTLIYPPKQRAVDVDASWKSLLDALVHAEAIWNDSASWVVCESPVVLRGPIKRTIITIQEV